MVGTLALVLSLTFLVIVHHGTAALVLVVLAVAGAATLLLAAWRRRRLTRVLPKVLKRLAWRSDETAVAFAWRFARGRDRRVRILRSERGFARTPDGGPGRDQLTVFDGEGDQVIDRDVQPRRTYFYTLFIEPHGASHVVRMEIPTLSAEERAAVEATYGARPYVPRGARYTFMPEGPCDPVDEPGSVSSWRAGTTHGASIVGEVLGGFATDAVFKVADLFAGDEPPDGWVEIT
jgi:hypothetical protein